MSNGEPRPPAEPVGGPWITGKRPVNTDALIRALILAQTRQREVALPEPVGVILPDIEDYKGLTHVFGLQVVLVDGARPGLIIPLEI